MHTQKYINGIEILRFLAFVVIFVFHQGNAFLTNLSLLSVTVFFVISGFVLNHRYEEETVACSLKDCFRFAFHRIKKIYPLHLILMLFVILLFSFNIICNFGFAKWLEKMPIPILANVLLIQSWTLDLDTIMGVNAVSWFLSAILFSYFCFPIIKNRLKSMNVKHNVFLVSAILIMQTLIYYLSRKLLTDISLGTYFFPLFRLGDFVCGYCTYNIFYKYQNIDRPSATVMDIAAIFLVIIFHFLHNNIENCPYFIENAFRILLSCYLVFVFSNKNGMATKYITNKVTLYLGHISSYAWLIHGFFVQFVNYMLPMLNVSIPGFVTLIFNFIVVMFLAYLYDKYIVKNKNKTKILENHDYQLDFIRIVCMIGVLVFHFSTDNGQNITILYKFKNAGYATLYNDCFFMISGFALYGKYSNNFHITDYIKSRFVAAFPLFWISWLFCSTKLLIQNRGWFVSLPLSRYILTVIGLDGYLSQDISTFYLVGEWFFGALIICYLLFPLLLKLSKSNKSVLSLTISLFTIHVLQQTIDFPTMVSSYPSICRCLLGMCLGILIYKNKKMLINLKIFIFSLFIFILLIFLGVRYYGLLFCFIHDISFFIVFYNIGFYVVKNSYAKQILHYLSKYSFGFYLLHHGILDVLLICLKPYNYKTGVLIIFMSFFTTLIISIVLTSITKHIIKEAPKVHIEVFRKLKEPAN